MIDFAGLYNHIYTLDYAKIDGFGPYHPRPLKCNDCQVNVPREAYRQWGNPYCGPCYRHRLSRLGALS